MKTMDAMTSDRSVRRPRIRTESEGSRRRQSDRAKYARKKNALNTKNNLWCIHTRTTNQASPARDGINDNKIFKLSTRDALNEKQWCGELDTKPHSVDDEANIFPLHLANSSHTYLAVPAKMRIDTTSHECDRVTDVVKVVLVTRDG